jgi:hypothetical protein
VGAMDTTANPSAQDPASYQARPRDGNEAGGAEEGRCVAGQSSCERCFWSSSGGHLGGVLWRGGWGGERRGQTGFWGAPFCCSRQRGRTEDAPGWPGV